jgi:hypothetical protein
MEASVLLSITDTESDINIGETKPEMESDEPETETKKNSYYIIGIVGAVVIVLSFVILFASSKKLLCFR